uniref:Uncharacterized protein n=1 Tax=Anguilla anguilla TaxID=7936 RepID=A0A0E9RNR1_ANGAN
MCSSKRVNCSYPNDQQGHCCAMSLWQTEMLGPITVGIALHDCICT